MTYFEVTDDRISKKYHGDIEVGTDLPTGNKDVTGQGDEIYKSEIENVRIKNQLCGSIQDLTKANPSFAAGLETAKEAVACAENDKNAAKAALDAAK